MPKKKLTGSRSAPVGTVQLVHVVVRRVVRSANRVVVAQGEAVGQTAVKVPRSVRLPRFQRRWEVVVVALLGSRHHPDGRGGQFVDGLTQEGGANGLARAEGGAVEVGRGAGGGQGAVAN